MHGRRPRVPDEWPRGLASLVRDCLGQARTLRPSFTAIVERLHHIDVKQSVRAHDEPDCPINSGMSPLETNFRQKMALRYLTIIVPLLRKWKGMSQQAIYILLVSLSLISELLICSSWMGE